ncbi:MAG: PqqD family protein [Acidobacteriota bacterium]|nr:PqqD family protein [Acidobacteriota bacterium]
MQPSSRRNGIVVQDLQEETLVYDLESNKAFCLNETSALIWKACDGTRTVSEITDHVNRDLDDSANGALVEFALDQLLKEGLIEGYESNSHKQSGVSRRSVLKTLGLSTAVALPVVASLIAPPASFAQSGCIVGMQSPAGCPCNNNGDCINSCVAGMCN